MTTTQNRKLAQLILMTALLLGAGSTAFLGAGSAGAEDLAYPVEIYTHDFYDDITVASIALTTLEDDRPAGEAEGDPNR